MAKIRDILVCVSIETAIRDRKCHRSEKHKVQAGQNFLSIRQSQGLGSKNYCRECAREILTAAADKLAEFSKQFGL